MTSPLPWASLTPRFHFASLAHDNAALSSHITTTPTPTPAPAPVETTSANLALLPTPAPVLIAGTQTVHKYSHDPTGAPRPGHESDMPDSVYIALALWRVNVLVTDTGARKRADLVLSFNVPASAGGEERERVEGWFKEAVGDMKIVDWGLFGDE